jgi:hypothetical protein
MWIDMAVTVDLGAGSALTGAETFELACTYGPTADSPWVRVTADGFEKADADGSWTEYLGALGIWDKYPSVVANAIYDAFRPILFFTPSDASTLFHDVQFA